MANQLPVSAARWQHCSQICLGIFITKNHKIAKSSTNTKAREKIIQDLETLQF
jgi:hypothetical protein